MDSIPLAALIAFQPNVVDSAKTGARSEIRVTKACLHLLACSRPVNKDAALRNREA